ncbi:tetR family transcriptional regulator domain protein [Acinetobacter baumannii 647609]|nr:tetR family transcriptional regulator domain protein [Acinetobacter baumannii 647609]
MPNLVLPTRALKVVNTSIELFHRRGFHIVGVDRLLNVLSQIKNWHWQHGKHQPSRIMLQV